MTSAPRGFAPAVHPLAALICIFLSLVTPAAGSFAQTTSGYAGPKKTVAVAGFDAAELFGGTMTNEALDQMLVEALMKDGRFVVAERLAFAQIQSEQGLGQEGTVTAETAARQGQGLGASILIRGAVTQFQPQAGGARVGVGGLDLFHGNVGDTLGVSSQEAVVKISLRLIDSSTGQIRATANGEGTASAQGFSADLYTHGGMEIGTSAFRQTPLGKAAEEAITAAVSQIALGIEKQPWSAFVVENADGKIFVSAGTDQNMSVGTLLRVYRKGRDLTDPGTGAVLETEFDTIGTIQIDGVREKVSHAVVTSGGQPQRGDIVKLK